MVDTITDYGTVFPEVDKTSTDRSVSKKDQLNYRVTIQGIAEKCLHTMHTPSIKKHVEGLQASLFFSIPGLPFRERITKYEGELDAEIKELEMELILKYDDGIYYHPKTIDDLTCMHRDQLKEKLFYTYYHNKLNFLLSLLAEHDALLKPKDFVESGESL